MKNKALVPVVAYLRTSTSTNAGADKDSEKRQREAIHAYASSNGYQIVDEYYDITTGETDIDGRPAFGAMMERLLTNGVKTVIVETASRFSRDLIVQEIGFRKLSEAGITLIASDKPDAFLDDGPTATLIRQVLGAVSQFEKAMLVNKLKGARDRKSKELGRKIDVRKGVHELYPEATARAKKLRRYDRLSLRAIAAKLAEEGHLTRKGTVFGANMIKTMIEA